MSEDKKAFLLYQNFGKQFNLLSDEQAGKLIKALFKYSDTGEEPELDAVTSMLFSLISDTLDRDKQKWEATREQRRQAGRKSAEARAERKSAKETNVQIVQQNETKEASVHFAQQASANPTVSVKAKGNARGIVTDIEKKERRKKFVPPTLAELQTYVLEKGYHFSPEAFLSYYESVGWLIGGRSRMKSWKSACLTWENREKQGKKQENDSQFDSDRSIYR